MSGHTLPYDLNSAPYEMADPGPGVTFSPDRWNASIGLVIADGDQNVTGPGATAAGEMDLQAPTADGQRLRITVVSRAGSGVRTLRSINKDMTEHTIRTQDLTTAVATYLSGFRFDAVGETVILESMPVGDGTYEWHSTYIRNATTEW